MSQGMSPDSVFVILSLLAKNLTQPKDSSEFILSLQGPE